MAGISDETYEWLRQVLEKQNGHAYSSEEAKEIGDGLINFYLLLIECDDDLKICAKLLHEQVNGS
jgi:hypothetical protein